MRHLLLYAHFNISDSPNRNLVHFLSKDKSKNADKKIISNSSISNKHGIKYIYQPDSFFDFGMWRDYLNSIEWDVDKYERIILINCSVMLQNGEWFKHLDNLEEDEFFGTTINMEMHPHLQSFFIAITPEQLFDLREPIFGNTILNLPHQTYQNRIKNKSRSSVANRRRAAFIKAGRSIRRRTLLSREKQRIIRECEIKLSEVLLKKGNRIKSEMYDGKSFTLEEARKLKRASNMSDIMHNNPYSFVKNYGYF